MAPPQGLFQFPSIQHFVSGSVTLSQGITPSVITMRCAAHPGPFLYRGSFQLSYGPTVINFPNCLIDAMNYEVDQAGKQYVNFTILDRRWRWQGFGHVAGEYNVRRSAKPNSLTREKTPKELAKLCFEALKETKFDVSQLPNNTRPYVDWDGPPAEYLAQLCDSLGCRIVYDVLSDVFRIVQTGVGKQLPTSNFMAASLAVNPPQVPDKITFRAGRTLYESVFPLEAVGREPDGEIRPIDKLSYAPPGGWNANYPPVWGMVKKEFQELAKSCIYRMFRVQTPTTVWGHNVQTLDQLLPFESTRLVTKQMFSTKKLLDGEERIPVMLVGRWYGGSELDTDEVKSVDTPAGKLSVYERGYSFDPERGIITTSSPLFLFSGTHALTRQIQHPHIWLWVAHGFRDEKTGAFERYEKSYSPPGSKLGTPPLIIDRRDIELRYWHHTKAKTVDNQDEVDKHAQYYITEYLRTLQLLNPGTGTYPGLIPISPDGAITSVTWTVDDKGYAHTSMARNQERDVAELSYQETRFLQSLKVMQKTDAAKQTEQKKRA